MSAIYADGVPFELVDSAEPSRDVKTAVEGDN
jgi:hypothetical protein